MFVSWQWRAAWGKPPLLHRKYSERRAQRQTKTQVLWVVVCLLALAPVAVRPQPTEPQPVFYKYNCLLTNARRITTKKDMRQARFSSAFARGVKICALYFEIQGTYFKIQGTYFFFAPRGGKLTVNSRMLKLTPQCGQCLSGAECLT